MYVDRKVKQRRKPLRAGQGAPPQFSMFKASAMRRHPFMKRHDLSLRCCTTIAQRLPKNLEPELSGFHKLTVYPKKRRNCHIYLQQIGNMDETPLRYDMPVGRSVSRKGDKTILIQTTGHEEDHFTHSCSIVPCR